MKKLILLIILMFLVTGCIGAGMSDYIYDINDKYHIARSNSRTIMFYDNENNIIVNKKIVNFKVNNDYIIFEREFEDNDILSTEYIIFNFETEEKLIYSTEEELNEVILNLNINNLDKWIETKGLSTFNYFSKNQLLKHE